VLNLQKKESGKRKKEDHNSLKKSKDKKVFAEKCFLLLHFHSVVVQSGKLRCIYQHGMFVSV
jgi:hypothetical protein